MHEHAQVYPVPSSKLSQKRKSLAPENDRAFQEFSRQVFAPGALDAKTKQLIAVAVAHVTQCPYCIRSHTKLARRDGATEQEVIEAMWVAAEMRAGAAVSHALIALEAMDAGESPPPAPGP
jgi:AhpD family alkylhydroperoxidase